MSELIQIEQIDDIAEISLNRPEAYNAFNYELVSQLANQLTTLAGESRCEGGCHHRQRQSFLCRW